MFLYIVDRLRRSRPQSVVRDGIKGGSTTVSRTIRDRDCFLSKKKHFLPSRRNFATNHCTQKYFQGWNKEYVFQLIIFQQLKASVPTFRSYTVMKFCTWLFKQFCKVLTECIMLGIEKFHQFFFEYRVERCARNNDLLSYTRWISTSATEVQAILLSLNIRTLCRMETLCRFA